MPVTRRFPLLIFLGLFLVTCQRDSDAPAGPGRDLQGTAPSACRQNGDFGQASQIYTNNQTRSDKLSQCRDIESDADAAEAGINALLVALSQDSQLCLDGNENTLCVLAAVGSASLAQSISDFAQESCNLSTLDDDECLVPTADDVTSGGWVAATGGEDAIVTLPNGQFAVQIDDLKSEFETGGIFVSIRENDPTPVLGPCPGSFENDCEQQNVEIDTDPEGAFETDGLYVEICEDEGFVTELASCNGGICNEGNPPGDHAEILTCTIGRKFSATSTFVGTDDDARVRDVLCRVTSKSAGISTGTLCRLFTQPANDLVGSCTTAATGQKTAECTIAGLAEVPAADTCFLLRGDKVVGTGSHTGQTAFCMSPGDPARGVTEIQSFTMRPSGQN